ncbi:Formyltransferase [Polyplosphaeria fusca]|uniref:Formyltransferase n=1 Tax=Polyplosphaeria fusca TaxID=682080 RepID=A0A9P4RCN7_9PLEO|nr:Formyltransferase [Polyplosphaeria fusca]
MVCRVIRLVPIKHVAAQELKLETHEIDTFTGWKPPIPFDLIIAVSFGLFVPPRILSGMRHGGLNVHPSLLPDLRGPAPIHHTLLKGRSHTGVTIQTLHPKHFDHGTILAQTQPPGLHLGSVAGLTLAKLTTVLGEEGAKMLLHVIRARKFINPRVDAGWYAESGGPVGHAEKITKQYTYVDLALATAQDIQVRHNVLGDLWSHLPNGERIILDDVKLITPDRDTRQAPGFFIDEEDRLKLRTSSGGVLLINRCTLPGGKRGGANEPVKRILSAV